MSKDRSLVVNEIFYSLQGESTFAGLPCAFVRLMGCPLRCRYCDTEYAFHEGRTQSFLEIIAELTRYPCKLVELTGGEPLAQKNSFAFMQELVNLNYKVLLETSGAISLAEVPKEVTIIMDVKTPGSGEVERMLWDNMAFLKPGIDEVKFVVCNKEDFEFMQEIEAKYQLTQNFNVLVSPEFGKVELPEMATWLMDSGKNYRMQTQLHKLIWDPKARGV